MHIFNLLEIQLHKAKYNSKFWATPQYTRYLPCWLQRWPSKTQSQGHGQPEGSEEGTPTAPQTKGGSQWAISEIPRYGRNKHSPGSGMATGHTSAAGWRQVECMGCEELQDIYSKDLFSSLCPLRCTNAPHQYRARGWNALELPSHGNCCAAGTYFPPSTKYPVKLPDVPWVSAYSHVAVPCLGAALGHWSAVCRAPAGYPGTARSSAVLTRQLRPVEERWRTSSGTDRY